MDIRRGASSEYRLYNNTGQSSLPPVNLEAFHRVTHKIHQRQCQTICLDPLGDESTILHEQSTGPGWSINRPNQTQDLKRPTSFSQKCDNDWFQWVFRRRLLQMCERVFGVSSTRGNRLGSDGRDLPRGLPVMTPSSLLVILLIVKDDVDVLNDR